MTTPHQSSVMKSLQAETNQALDSVIDAGWTETRKWWKLAKERMKMIIAHEYRRMHHDSTWNLTMATLKGTLNSIDQEVARILSEFNDHSIFDMNRSLNRIYRHSVLRHAWMLDNATPKSYDVRLPRKIHYVTEAVRTMTPAAYAIEWADRWATWTNAYRGALANNLRLGALNESTVDDAADEVDATKAGSPASFLDDVFQRLYMSQAVISATTGATDLFGENGDLIDEEIWQTRYKLDVCDICLDNAGKTMDEADSEIPPHPNCRCYWRVVPRAWAELLRSGSADDRALAKDLDARNAVPDRMIIRDEDGSIAGSVVVSFERWLKGAPMVAGIQ